MATLNARFEVPAGTAVEVKTAQRLASIIESAAADAQARLARDIEPLFESLDGLFGNRGAKATDLQAGLNTWIQRQALASMLEAAPKIVEVLRDDVDITEEDDGDGNGLIYFPTPGDTPMPLPEDDWLLAGRSGRDSHGLVQYSLLGYQPPVWGQGLWR